MNEEDRIDPVRTGKFIAKLRKTAGMTQEELGKQLFITRKAISKWETGKATPTIDMLKTISVLFHVTLDDMIQGDMDKTIQRKKEREEEQKINERRHYMSDFSVVLFILVLALLMFITFRKDTKIYHIDYDDENIAIHDGTLILSNGNDSSITINSLSVYFTESNSDSYYFMLTTKDEDGAEDLLLRFMFNRALSFDNKISNKIRKIMESNKKNLYLKIISEQNESIIYEINIFDYLREKATNKNYETQELLGYNGVTSINDFYEADSEVLKIADNPIQESVPFNTFSLDFTPIYEMSKNNYLNCLKHYMFEFGGINYKVFVDSDEKTFIVNNTEYDNDEFVYIMEIYRIVFFDGSSFDINDEKKLEAKSLRENTYLLLRSFLIATEENLSRCYSE